ncbi:hypothetical protein MTO96_034389 [Rhipicephalus appendiculatus]
MLRVVQCGFKPVEGLDDYFRPSLLRKGRRLLDNNHVFGVREVDETAISAKCLSEQSKHAYEVHLNVAQRKEVSNKQYHKPHNTPRPTEPRGGCQGHPELKAIFYGGHGIWTPYRTPGSDGV